VHVHEAEALAAWNPDFLPAVRDAFDTWVQAGIPVRFTFVADAAGADIQVAFIDRFTTGISGKTVWSRDGNHWLLSGDIQLAVAHPSGGTLTAPQMRAIALHEVGHLLGLDHTANADNIMSARVRVRDLSDVDKATVRLVYAVPAGSVKREPAGDRRLWRYRSSSTSTRLADPRP
jgi:predicted Zn-dependent protease